VFSGTNADVIVVDDNGPPNTGTVKRYDYTGATLKATLGGLFDRPRTVTISAAGDVYVGDAGRISKFTAGAGSAVTIGSGWVHPNGIWVNSAGDVYVADSCDAYFIAAGTSTKTRLFGLGSNACSNGEMKGVATKSGC
jgi:hypothetical protein